MAVAPLGLYHVASNYRRYHHDANHDYLRGHVVESGGRVLPQARMPVGEMRWGLVSPERRVSSTA